MFAESLSYSNSPIYLLPYFICYMGIGNSQEVFLIKALGTGISEFHSWLVSVWSYISLSVTFLYCYEICFFSWSYIVKYVLFLADVLSTMSANKVSKGIL